MVDACYLCRRTQADLDHLNEEVRTRVYLSYFSNVRSQIDEQQRRLGFLQRLKDEEGGDPHFRIQAAQVFADPGAYKKLMPWVESLVEIARTTEDGPAPQGTVAELVEGLLAKEHTVIVQMEESLAQLRSGFAAGSRSPLALHAVTCAFPVDWSAEAPGLKWRPSHGDNPEPMRRTSAASKATVDVRLHICTACRALTNRT